MIKMTRLASAVAVALSVTLAASALAEIKREEKVELKLATGAGPAEVLMLEDFQNFPIGATETVLTEAGTEALVTRNEDGLLIELGGEQIEVDIAHGGFGMNLEALDMDIDIDEIVEAQGEPGARHVVVLADHDVHVVEDGEWTVDIAGDENGEKRRVIVRMGDGGLHEHEDHDMDIEIAGAEGTVVKHKVVVIERESIEN